ncbi:MAG: phytanoyl-CoA dioxygenase family protein [Rhodospirillaceae bacterium]|nr:phytanoyl-CoA dioxygenase family protein [Rhodospirillaceae bacterium]
MDGASGARAESYPLTQADIEAYHRDGIVCLRGVFDPAAVEGLRAAVAWSMDHPGPWAMNFVGDKTKPAFFGDVFGWSRHAAYRDLCINRYAAEIAGRLMGAKAVRFYFDHLLVKEPGSAAPTPWHQDAPYFAIKGDQCCSIWIALDPVTRETGAVEYVRGSHRWGKFYEPAGFTNDGRLRNDALEKAPDIDAARERYDIACWDMAPGDVTVHHVLTLHGAPGNVSATQRRRGLSLRFIGDDIMHDLRPGIPHTMTESLKQLAPHLRPGAPLSGDAFPLLWSAP